MANIKSQIKRNLTNEKRHQANVAFKSSYKTAVKAVHSAVTAKNKELAMSSLSIAHMKLDKGQAKGIFHKNFVARHKASLASLVNTL